MNRFIDIYLEKASIQLHTRTWSSARRPFLLVHGLASNSRIWDAVADRLAQAGHESSLLLNEVTDYVASPMMVMTLLRSLQIWHI